MNYVIDSMAKETPLGFIPALLNFKISHIRLIQSALIYADSYERVARPIPGYSLSCSLLEKAHPTISSYFTVNSLALSRVVW